MDSRGPLLDFSTSPAYFRAGEEGGLNSHKGRPRKLQSDVERDRWRRRQEGESQMLCHCVLFFFVWEIKTDIHKHSLYFSPTAYWP